MPNHPKPVALQRHEDGVPSVLRKATVYTNLHFYRKSDVLVQLTKVFCERFLPKSGDRTVDQMVQASRSVKQNIVEGFTDGQTSFAVELKLLGIAQGSNRELLEDYQDYLKHRGLTEWALGKSPRFNDLHTFCLEHSDVEDYRPYFYRFPDEDMANCAICLCHMVDKALSSFIARRDREFVEEGGVRERMMAARLEHRGTQKEVIETQAREIETQAREIERLKALVASLQQEVALLRGRQEG